MFSLRNKENIFQLCSLIWSPDYVQCSPIIMLCLGSVGIDYVISVPCYEGNIFTKEL